MNAEAFAQSLASGPHALLSSLIGDWRGTTRTWFTPGELSDTSGTTGGVRAILGGAFVVHEYAGSLGGDKLSGLATLGFDLGEQRFVCAWVDSFHNGTGVMLSRGDPGVTDAISVLGSYDVSGGSPWGWRTVFDTPGADELVVSHFNIPPGTTEYLAVETRYRRVR